MKKYNFTHVPCPLIRAIKNCAPHSHFDETFFPEDTGKVVQHSFAPHARRNCSQDSAAEGEQQCCALLTFSMAPGRWVSRGSPTDQKCLCCGPASHMGPWSLQGKMLMEYLLPKDLAVGKSSLTDPSYNKHCHSRKPPQLPLTQGLQYVKWLTGSCPEVCRAGRTSLSPQHFTDLTAHHCPEATEMAPG